MDADEATLRYSENEFEWSEDISADEPRKDLMEVLEQLGAKISPDEDGRNDFQISDQVKQNYFRNRFDRLKKIVQEMTLETFSCDGVSDVQEIVEESYDNAVYLGDYGYDRFLSFDRFIWEAETDVSYYIGNVILMH